jgi:hypothetical protein
MGCGSKGTKDVSDTRRKRYGSKKRKKKIVTKKKVK